VRQQLRRFVVDETGQDLIEYSLLAALLAIVSIAALNVLGTKLPKVFEQVTGSL
jgi:pilus assembly protein Flp/PilA